MAENSKIEWTDGRKVGAEKSAARKTGCSHEEWRRRRSAGERWCYRCRAWKRAENFARDRSRSTGSASICKPCNSARSTRSRYAISEEDLAMLEAQGACPICERIGQRMEIDHDHSTGAVRARLCSRCNGALGQFLDDPRLLRRAIAYLERFSG